MYFKLKAEKSNKIIALIIKYFILIFNTKMVLFVVKYAVLLQFFFIHFYKIFFFGSTNMSEKLER